FASRRRPTLSLFPTRRSSDLWRPTTQGRRRRDWSTLGRAPVIRAGTLVPRPGPVGDWPEAGHFGSAAASAQVVVPDEASGHGAVRTPALPDRLELVRSGRGGGPAQVPDTHLARPVAGGPHIGAAQGGEEVHVGGPRPYPDLAEEAPANLVVGEGLETVEVQTPFQHRRGQELQVPLLLAGEAGAS